jgi:hypothetical protein
MMVEHVIKVRSNSDGRSYEESKWDLAQRVYGGRLCGSGYAWLAR